MGTHHRNPGGNRGGYRVYKYEFGKQLLTLRTRISFTQSELAQAIAVHRRSVQNWETGESYPKADALQRLIEVFLAHGAFSKGKEREEVESLWNLAGEDGSQALPRFDAAWFERTFAAHNPLPSATPVAPSTEQGWVPQPPPLAPVITAPALIDWGEAIATPMLYGRDEEIETLQRWIVQDRCRVVTLLGLGGIGKSSLAITFGRGLVAHAEANGFDVVLFRSLQNGPPLAQVLDQTIRAISNQQAIVPEVLPEALSDKIALLVQLFRERRCLLILDNFETVLQPGTLTGTYRTGYADYGLLLRALAEREHQSCLLLTSREKPAELGPLEGRATPVRTLALSGLPESACQFVLEAKELVGTSDEYHALARLYGGNPLALHLVSEPILEIFGGDVAAFLATDDAFFNGMSRLLDQQFARSAPLEQAILHWLAIEREFVPFNALLADLGENVPQREVLGALESLRRRMLIERSANRPAFTLQPVILEYVTEQLIEIIRQEIVDGQPNLLQSHVLMQATAKDYIRHSQEQLIATPILERLGQTLRNRGEIEDRFSTLLANWRGCPQSEQEYGPGNVVNLLRLLRGDLKGQDLTNLFLRQVYLQGVAAHDTTLAGSYLTQSIFQEPFAGIESVACSPDMRYLAVGTVNGEIRLWEVANRTTLLAVKAHTGPVVGLALSMDGQLLASGSADGTIRLWDVATGHNLALLTGHTSVVWCVALSADKRLLASGSGDGTVRLWHIESPYTAGACIAILEGHTSAVRGIALSADGRLLVSGSFDGTVRLWDLSTLPNGDAMNQAINQAINRTTIPPCLAILDDHRAGVYGVAFSANGKLLASSSYDRTVRLWDITNVFANVFTNVFTNVVGGDGQTPPCLAILEGHGDAIRSVTMSADGTIVASGSGDKTIRLWDFASTDSQPPNGTCFAILEGHTNAVMSMALAADGQLLASGSTDGTVRLWDVRSGICLAVLEGHTNAVMSVALAANQSMLASGGTDGKVRLWDVASGDHLATLHGHTSMAMGVAFAPDGQRLVSSSGDGTLRLWDVRGEQNRYDQNRDGQNAGESLAILTGHSNVVRGVAWSSDGRLLASGSYDGTIRLWDMRRGVHLCTLREHTNMVMSVAFSHDGRLLASGSFDGTVRLWDTSMLLKQSAETPPCLAVLQEHSAVVYGVALSADGRWLASCSFDRTVRLWDTAAILNPEEAGTTSVVISEEYRGEVWSVALSSDGQRLATGDTEGSVRLWQAGSLDGSLENLAICEGHTSAIWSVTFSADGELLASGSGDGTVRLWSSKNGAHLRTVRAARPYERMDISGLSGITEAQRASLLALGAIERTV